MAATGVFSSCATSPRKSSRSWSIWRWNDVRWADCSAMWRSASAARPSRVSASAWIALIATPRQASSSFASRAACSAGMVRSRGGGFHRGALAVIRELVAEAGYRQDVFRMGRIRLDLLTQVRDVEADVVILLAVLVTPDLGQQGFGGH